MESIQNMVSHTHTLKDRVEIYKYYSPVMQVTMPLTVAKLSPN